MAAVLVATQPRGETDRVRFRCLGKQRAFPLGKVSSAEAEAKSAHVDYLLLRLVQGLIEIPPGMGVVDFDQFDGKAVTKTLRLGALRNQFVDARKAGREANTRKMSAIHF